MNDISCKTIYRRLICLHVSFQLFIQVGIKQQEAMSVQLDNEYQMIS